MREAFKEAIRRFIFYFWPGPDEFIAETGTLKHRFLTWLYGNGEPEFDCIMPEEKK